MKNSDFRNVLGNLCHDFNQYNRLIGEYRALYFPSDFELQKTKPTVQEIKDAVEKFNSCVKKIQQDLKVFQKVIEKNRAYSEDEIREANSHIVDLTGTYLCVRVRYKILDQKTAPIKNVHNRFLQTMETINQKYLHIVDMNIITFLTKKDERIFKKSSYYSLAYISAAIEDFQKNIKKHSLVIISLHKVNNKNLPVFEKILKDKTLTVFFTEVNNFTSVAQLFVQEIPFDRNQMAPMFSIIQKIYNELFNRAGSITQCYTNVKKSVPETRKLSKKNVKKK
jgi:hypothetical protein